MSVESQEDDATNRPTTDHWGKAVSHYGSEVNGAGESRQCQSCGSRFKVALIAATASHSCSNWEEFYECQSCGSTGSFRVYGEKGQREWTGRIDYPEE